MPWVVLLAAILRTIAFLTRHNGPVPLQLGHLDDYRLYALNLSMHHQFSYHWPTLSSYRLPLYPVLLMPFLKHPDLFLGLQAALSVWTVFIAWRFIKWLSSSTVANWSCLLLALDLPSIQDSIHFTGDTVFTFLVLIAFIQTWYFAKGSSILWSLAAICRTHGIYIPLGLSVLWKPAWLAVALSLPIAWMVRNKVAVNDWRLSNSSDYYTVCLGAIVEGMEKGTGPTKTPEDPYVNVSKKDLSKAQKIILSHPLTLAHYMVSASFKFFMATNSEYILDWLNIKRSAHWNDKGTVSGKGTINLLGEHLWMVVPTILLTAIQAIFYYLFIIGIFSLPWQHLFLTAWTFLCLWIPAILVSGSPHYRVSLIPIICIGASVTLGKKRCFENFPRPETLGGGEGRGSLL